MLNILQSRSQKELIYNLMVFAIYILIMTLVLRFLWNKSLVKHISVLKSVDTLPQTLLLAIAIAMFKC
jgi:hypothetical protein